MRQVTFQTISLLRHALACIWTEIDYTENIEIALANSQKIANEALESTEKFATAKDLTNDLKGIEAWEEMTKKPLPCPHCGKQPKCWQDEDPYGPGGPIPTDYVIECCAELRHSTKEKAIKLWNTRCS